MPFSRDEISATLRKLIAEKRTIARPPVPAAYGDDADFTDNLGFDSLDHVELIMAVEDHYGIEVPDAAAEELKTVGNAIDYLARRFGAAVPA